MAMDDSTGAEPTSVYRYYDRNDVLIYVGITKRGIARNREHESKQWWPWVVRQEVEHLPSRLKAQAREEALIRRFSPPFNKQHNPLHQESRAAYLQLGTRLDASLQISRATLPKSKRVHLNVFSRKGMTHLFSRTEDAFLVSMFDSRSLKLGQLTPGQPHARLVSLEVLDGTLQVQVTTRTRCRSAVLMFGMPYLSEFCTLKQIELALDPKVS